MNDVPDNVKAFIGRCSDVVGNFERNNFHRDAIYFVSTGCARTPIEQLFESATRTLIKLTKSEFDTFLRYTEEGSVERTCYGLNFLPQYKIGKYRTDYMMQNMGNGQKLVVELDGHEFHDKDEKQRRYEKSRDRYMQKHGFTVFRYTGSEIFKDPFQAAIECVAFLDIGFDENELRAMVGA